MSEKFNIEFFPCDSGVGSSFNESDNISNYEYDLQHIPLTLCNLKFGLEDRLESINDSFNAFSNQIDGAQEKFKSCDTKLKDIKTLLDVFTRDLNLFKGKKGEKGTRF